MKSEGPIQSLQKKTKQCHWVTISIHVYRPSISIYIFPSAYLHLYFHLYLHLRHFHHSVHPYFHHISICISPFISRFLLLPSSKKHPKTPWSTCLLRRPPSPPWAAAPPGPVRQRTPGRGWCRAASRSATPPIPGRLVPWWLTTDVGYERIGEKLLEDKDGRRWKKIG